MLTSPHLSKILLPYNDNITTNNSRLRFMVHHIDYDLGRAEVLKIGEEDLFCYAVTGINHET